MREVVDTRDAPKQFMDYKWGGAHGAWLETKMDARVCAKTLRRLPGFFPFSF